MPPFPWFYSRGGRSSLSFMMPVPTGREVHAELSYVTEVGPTLN